MALESYFFREEMRKTRKKKSSKLCEGKNQFVPFVEFWDAASWDKKKKNAGEEGYSTE